MPIFGPKCQFWAKFGRFWAQNPIFWGQGVKILVPSYRDSNETPFSCWKHWSVRLQLAARGENVLFWPQNLDIWGENVLFLPKNLDIWGKKSIFCMVIAIFVNRAYYQSPCSRPLCKCADFGAVEPRNLGDFRSNFNGGEILRASLLLSPRLIFSSK